MSGKSPDDQQTLDAALELWSEKGYANSTLRELARRLGIGISKLYEQFPSKEHLVFFLYRQLNQQALEKF
ncbi:MAG: helix-turn-helix domain-containing protein, partial [Pirellulaceae bacterium]